MWYFHQLHAALILRMSSLLSFRVSCLCVGGSLVWHMGDQSEWAGCPFPTSFPSLLFLVSFFIYIVISPASCLYFLTCLFLFGSVFLSGYPGSYCIFYVALNCQVHSLRSYSLPISCFLFPVLCWWAENRLSVVSFHHVAVWTLSFHRGEWRHWFFFFFFSWRTSP